MIKPTLEQLEPFDRRSCVLPYRAGFLVRNIFWARWKWAIKLADLKRSDRVMDFGCGGGFVFPELARHVAEIYGADMFIDPCMDRFMEEYKIGCKVSFAKADIREPLEQENFFDAAFCMDVIEHMTYTDAQMTVNNMERSLKKNGRLVVSIPIENTIYSKLANLTGFKKISMKEPHFLNWREVVSLFKDFKFVAGHDIPLPYPFCLYKIMVWEKSVKGGSRTGDKG